MVSSRLLKKHCEVRRTVVTSSSCPVVDNTYTELLFLLFLPLSLFAEKSELFLAVDAQDLAKVTTELAKRANVNEKVEGGFTPLTLGIGLNDRKIKIERELA